MIVFDMKTGETEYTTELEIEDKKERLEKMYTRDRELQLQLITVDEASKR